MTNQKSEKELIRMAKGLPVFNYHAAGVDLGDTKHYIAINDGEGGHIVKSTTAFTCDLHEIVNYLLENKITTVAMESTGVYWVALYQLLEKAGLEVYLVNAAHVKNVTGRKKDDTDAIWIQKLHTCGLLKKSFQPTEDNRELREYTRHRDNYIRLGADAIRRMQKAMEQMNIKLHTVISDIVGKSGMEILKSILAGERNPETLYLLCDGRIKAGKEEIVKSLEGVWSTTQLSILRDELELYEFYQQKIKNWDDKIEFLMTEMIAKREDGEMPVQSEKPIKSKGKIKKNQFKFNAKCLLEKILDVDIMKVEGLGEITAINFFAEVGEDMSKWQTDKHFAAWLNLTPNNKITGGKQISSKTPKKKNRAGAILRQAASTVSRSKSPLGEYYRRIRSKQGGKGAVVATANKLSRILYTIIKTKKEFDINMLNKHQEKSNQEKIKRLLKQIEKLQKAA